MINCYKLIRILNLMVNNNFIIHYLVFITFIVSISAQLNVPLYQADFYLPSGVKKNIIPINSTLFTKINNGSNQYYKISVKLQILNQNGTYIDNPYKSGNIMVKYWKNNINTPASSVLSYSYQTISLTQKYKYATDQTDQGIVDIQALHNYQNIHNFIHIVGNQTSDILFVLGFYRFGNSNLTDLIGMSTLNDQFKISVTVLKSNASQLKCSFCSIKTFCPTTQCQCYQQTYSDCRVKKKTITPKIDVTSKINDVSSIQAGTISFIHVQPQTFTKQWFQMQLVIRLSDANTTRNTKIKQQNVFILMYTQNKTQPAYLIPSIYNFDLLDSPSLPYKIDGQFNAIVTKPSYQQAIRVKASNNLYLNEKVILNKNQVLTAAIYYIQDNQTILNNSNNSQITQLSMIMDMTFKSPDLFSDSNGNLTINLGFLIGMIVLGFIILLLIICCLHYMVSRRFNIFSIFMTSQSSNRTSNYASRRSKKVANLSPQSSSLPQISFDFMQRLVFKPLKYVYSSKVQQKYINRPNGSRPQTPSLNDVCSICLQDFHAESRVKYTYCGHILDSKCLQSWFQKQLSCPICRQKLQPEDIQIFEDKILQQVCQNIYYQNIVDLQVNALRKLYKQFEKRKFQQNITINGNDGTKYTQQSLVDNNQHISNKYLQTSKYIESTKNQIQTKQTIQTKRQIQTRNKIQNTIPNISTMICLQKTQQLLQPKIQNSNQNTIKKIKLQLNSEQPLQQQIKIQNLKFIIQIFNNNKTLSIKRFNKIYKFYRYIYLYHQINKKFQKDSNLYQPSFYFQEKSYKQNGLHQKQCSNQVDIYNNCLIMPNFIRQDQLTTPIKINKASSQVQQQRFIIRQNSDQFVIGQTDQQLQHNFDTQNSIRPNASFNYKTNKKAIATAFHLDFQQMDHQQPHLPQTKPQGKQNLNQQNQHFDMNQICQYHQANIIYPADDNSVKQKTNSSYLSKSLHLPIKNKIKHLTLRDQMNQLQRELQHPQNKPQKPQYQQGQLNKESQYKINYSVVYDSDDHEQNARYLDAPLENISTMRMQNNAKSQRLQTNSQIKIIPSLNLPSKKQQPSKATSRQSS